MPPQNEKSQLKRPRGSLPEDATESKKARRSDPLDAEDDGKTPVTHNQQLPTPGVKGDSVNDSNETTATPPGAKTDEDTPRKADEHWSQGGALSSPPQDTQPVSQFTNMGDIHDEFEDDADEGVWGYLQAWDAQYGDRPIVLKKRCACPESDSLEAATAKEPGNANGGTPKAVREEEAYERTKIKGVAAGGYLIGRHPECDVVVNDSVVSNRHCLIFAESNGTDTVAVLEDLSSNGTFVNEAIVGRNRSRELEDNDEIAIHRARFIFRYPKSRRTNGFLQQYTLLQKLGKGHFAEVYLCIEKSTGKRYAVKIFTSPGLEDKTKKQNLQAEIGMLMSVSHPNVLCLKDTFNEQDKVYLVLELAPEGELFNFIVANQKLKEDDTRKLFKQLFQGIKYLHERNIVHRDIKPENILLVDKNLHVKLADFGLAKIIGEESFTTTLCGTPSYVAPEILADSKNRRYTKAVDVWSLGVVLYICLCGFPPFSDELYSRDFPYTLSQQIRTGRFDYPSPYWDSIGDPALDLIDSMLVVDPEKRFTIDQCLAHPWLTQPTVNVNDSTGLVGGIAGLDVNRRAPKRERTLLASINELEIPTHVASKEGQESIHIYTKSQGRVTNVPKEQGPSHNRAPEEFMNLGGKGDPQLYGDDGVDHKGKSPIRKQ